MNVFLAGIIQGSLVETDIHDQDWRAPITDALARHVPGAEIYCHYSAHPDSITYGLPRIRETFQEGLDRAVASDLLIAFCPSASMGTAIEMYEAYRAGSAVLTVTPMGANWVVRCYSDRIFATVEQLEAFLASGELETVLAEASGRSA
jgi:hypothetical protein